MRKKALPLSLSNVSLPCSQVKWEGRDGTKRELSCELETQEVPHFPICGRLTLGSWPDVLNDDHIESSPSSTSDDFPAGILSKKSRGGERERVLFRFCSCGIPRMISIMTISHMMMIIVIRFIPPDRRMYVCSSFGSRLTSFFILATGICQQQNQQIMCQGYLFLTLTCCIPLFPLLFLLLMMVVILSAHHPFCMFCQRPPMIRSVDPPFWSSSFCSDWNDLSSKSSTAKHECLLFLSTFRRREFFSHLYVLIILVNQGNTSSSTEKSSFFTNSLHVLWLTLFHSFPLFPSLTLSPSFYHKSFFRYGETTSLLFLKKNVYHFLASDMVIPEILWIREGEREREREKCWDIKMLEEVVDVEEVEEGSMRNLWNHVLRYNHKL